MCFCILSEEIEGNQIVSLNMFSLTFYSHTKFYMVKELGHIKISVMYTLFQRYRYIYNYWEDGFTYSKYQSYLLLELILVIATYYLHNCCLSGSVLLLPIKKNL